MKGHVEDHNSDEINYLLNAYRLKKIILILSVKRTSDSMAAGIEKGTFSNFFDCHHDM